MKKYYILFFILLIGIVLRFYNLGVVPDGFHRDEAYLGYNAYSILNTGREMTGDFLPIHLSSFLFSPAGYSYFSIPFISMFGLNEFSVRFASAFFGSLTIIATFFLVLLIFEKNSFKRQLALATSFFIAISPWHINLSRTATDNVIVVFFTTVGVILYFLWFKKNYLPYGILGFFSFFLTLFIYQASRSFIPLLLPFLFLFSFLNFKDNKKFIISGILYSLLIVVPIFLVVSSPTLSYRLKTLSITDHPESRLKLEEQLREDGVNNLSSVHARFFHNKLFSYSSTFTENYFQHFSYNFLFTDKGLPDRYRVPYSGLLYLFELPLLFLGAWFLIRKSKKQAFFIIGWVLIAPVGSALTFDDIPNLQRTLIIFPALSIILAYGVLSIINEVKLKKYFPIAPVIVVVLISFSVSSYLHSYYIHIPSHRPWYRQEGYRQLTKEINKLDTNYEKVIISTSFSDPSIFFLFYNKYNPSLIQKKIKELGTSNLGSFSFDKFYFIDDPCPLKEVKRLNEKTGIIENIIEAEEGVLYVNNGLECRGSSRIKVLSEIKRPDGTIAFKIVKLIK